MHSLARQSVSRQNFTLLPSFCSSVLLLQIFKAHDHLSLFHTLKLACCPLIHLFDDFEYLFSRNLFYKPCFRQYHIVYRHLSIVCLLNLGIFQPHGQEFRLITLLVC